MLFRDIGEESPQPGGVMLPSREALDQALVEQTLSQFHNRDFAAGG
jgi:hypothetical protein